MPSGDVAVEQGVVSEHAEQIRDLGHIPEGVCRRVWPGRGVWPCAFSKNVYVFVHLQSALCVRRAKRQSAAASTRVDVLFVHVRMCVPSGDVAVEHVGPVEHAVHTCHLGHIPEGMCSRVLAQPGEMVMGAFEDQEDLQSALCVRGASRQRQTASARTIRKRRC